MAWPEGPWPCAEGADVVSDRKNDSATAAYTQKLPADDPRYKEVVAEPTMAAVDGLPKDYREKVWDYGYVDVYRAWRRRIPVAQIEKRAAAMGGRFVL